MQTVNLDGLTRFFHDLGIDTFDPEDYHPDTVAVIKDRDYPDNLLLIGKWGDANDRGTPKRGILSDGARNSDTIARRTAEQPGLLGLVTGLCDDTSSPTRFAAKVKAYNPESVTIGISPFRNLDEMLANQRPYGLAFDVHDVMVFSKEGKFVPRDNLNVFLTHGSFAFGGNTGTLHEIAITLEEGKVLGTIPGYGGATDMIANEVPTYMSSRIAPHYVLHASEDPNHLFDLVVTQLQIDRMLQRQQEGTVIDGYLRMGDDGTLYHVLNNRRVRVATGEDDWQRAASRHAIWVPYSVLNQDHAGTAILDATKDEIHADIMTRFGNDVRIKGAREGEAGHYVIPLTLNKPVIAHAAEHVLRAHEESTLYRHLDPKDLIAA